MPPSEHLRELLGQTRSGFFRSSEEPPIIWDMAERSVRGWNGILLLGDEGVAVRRGVRGILVRKRRDPDYFVPWGDVGLVRYAPARGVAGYVQIVERDDTSPAGDYLAIIRDPRTVTFSRNSQRWRRAAEEVAGRAGAQLDEAPPAPYRATVRSVQPRQGQDPQEGFE